MKKIKGKHIIYVLIGVVLILGFVKVEKRKIEIKANNDCVNATTWQNNPEEVIKSYFKFEKDHDVENLNKCYAKEPYEETRRTTKGELDNILDIKLLEMELSTNDILYEEALENNRKAKITREDIRIYSVYYNVKFFDDSGQPVPSGDDMTNFTLVRDKDSKWRITSIGL